jgi:hypothetical protein
MHHRVSLAKTESKDLKIRAALRWKLNKLWLAFTHTKSSSLPEFLLVPWNLRAHCIDITFSLGSIATYYALFLKTSYLMRSDWFLRLMEWVPDRSCANVSWWTGNWLSCQVFWHTSYWMQDRKKYCGKKGKSRRRVKSTNEAQVTDLYSHYL